MKRLAVILLAISMIGCNKQREEILPNPFFEQWTTPYGVPPFESIKTYHYQPAFERAISLHNEEIAAIVALEEEPTFENTIAAMDRSGRMLSDVVNVFSMICAAETNEQLQELEGQLMPQLTVHNDAILMNDQLFKRVKAVYDTRNSLDLDPDQIRLTEKIYDDFVRSGALLDAEKKARLAEINEELSALSVRFGSNVLAENNNFVMYQTEQQVASLPTSVRDAAREKAKELGEDGKYAFTLHKPSMLPFLTYSTEREAREELYRAYINRCNNNDEYDNKQIINDMIRLRTEKAHLLGYKSYAHYVTSDQMASNPKAVYSLLEEVWEPAVERAKEELAEMEKMFKEDFTDSEYTFESWDWWFYAEKVRQKKYALNEDIIRGYFSLDNTRQGIFNLANRLFGITFRPVTVPVYHKEVSAYEVLDKDESHLGILYFDFHPRAGKGQGAWCGYYREQRYEADGTRTAPVVSIVCNFTRPTESTPSLLTLDEVTTLFHEFGHALHFLFTDVRYNGLISVEGDFVELPSQIMENWALTPQMLRTYATHYRSGEIIRDQYISRIENSALFNQGFNTTELIAAALSDMDIHSTTEYSPIDVDGFEYNALYTKRGMISQIEPRYHYTYFAHIFSGGYSAGYYFYTWAEVLDKDAFEAFRETGDIFDRRTADAFRREILSKGGSKDGMSLYKAFRGKSPDKSALLKARGLWKEPEVDSIEITKEAREATIREMLKMKRTK
ncbi:MAG: M3 family metallopeptidase [Alistipes sp.]|nr:M3 family metallopeptidase [Alistipes sp.]